jgi:hypothetical protein
MRNHHRVNVIKAFSNLSIQDKEKFQGTLVGNLIYSRNALTTSLNLKQIVKNELDMIKETKPRTMSNRNCVWLQKKYKDANEKYESCCMLK